ncbi:DUF5671 domain-containing protein [Paracoccus sp. (in: a-proteobacteria)]|uniref:DUF5671 domain-containing protein n=1 Tax=Paracoccus sp. TaxID=267 RepID=UPI003A88E390
MKAAESLSEFVRAGLVAGAGRDAMGDALRQAGWSPGAVSAALESWAEVPGLPPVPRPVAYVPAREALLFGLMFISLGMVVAYTVVLGFGIINHVIPDPLQRFDPAGPSLRWYIALLIGFLPVFLLLDRRVNRSAAGPAARRRSRVQQWVASVSMLVAALVLLGDLVAVVYVFLNGGMSLRFVAKALLVAVMGLLVLAYFRDEMDA